MSAVRVGVLCYSWLFSYQVEALCRLLDSTGSTVSLVVVDENSTGRTAGTTGGITGLVTALLDHVRHRRWWALVQAERWLATQLGRRRETQRYLQPIDVGSIDEFDDATFVRCEPVSVDGGPWRTLPAHVVETVSEECDVVIHCGFWLVAGDVLSATEHGVLSFHPADVRRIRGLGPEVAFYRGDRTVGVTLQRLNERVDGGEIVAFDEIDISDARTLDEVKIRQFECQIRLLAAGVTALLEGSVDPAVPDELGAFHPVRERESLRMAGTIAAKNLLGRLQGA